MKVAWKTTTNPTGPAPLYTDPLKTGVFFAVQTWLKGRRILSSS